MGRVFSSKHVLICSSRFLQFLCMRLLKLLLIYISAQILLVNGGGRSAYSEGSVEDIRIQVQRLPRELPRTSAYRDDQLNDLTQKRQRLQPYVYTGVEFEVRFRIRGALEHVDRPLMVRVVHHNTRVLAMKKSKVDGALAIVNQWRPGENAVRLTIPFFATAATHASESFFVRISQPRFLPMFERTLNHSDPFRVRNFVLDETKFRPDPIDAFLTPKLNTIVHIAANQSNELRVQVKLTRRLRPGESLIFSLKRPFLLLFTKSTPVSYMVSRSSSLIIEFKVQIPITLPPSQNYRWNVHLIRRNKLFLRSTKLIYESARFTIVNAEFHDWWKVIKQWSSIVQQWPSKIKQWFRPTDQEEEEKDQYENVRIKLEPNKDGRVSVVHTIETKHKAE